jgi:WD40 repeat protein
LAADGSLLAVGYSDDAGTHVVVSEIPGGESFEVKVPEWPLNVFWLVADRIGRSVELILGEYASLDDLSDRHMWIRTIDVRRRELLPYRIELTYRTGGDAIITWDNDVILAVGERQVGLWDLETGSELAKDVYEAATHVGWTAIHPDGHLAALSGNGIIEVIDVSTGDLIKGLPNDEHFPLKVVFSPDGQWLATATVSGRVVVWNTRTWEQHMTWLAHSGFGSISMMFTPDSDFLVTGGVGQAAIWKIEQGVPGGVRLDVDPSRPDTDVRVAVRDDGDTLVTFTEGTGVRLWDVSPLGLLEHACAVVGRNLTRAEWEDVLPDRSYERTCPEYENG